VRNEASVAVKFALDIELHEIPALLGVDKESLLPFFEHTTHWIFPLCDVTRISIDSFFFNENCFVEMNLRSSHRHNANAVTNRAAHLLFDS
jgi:hypothetical protein